MTADDAAGAVQRWFPGATPPAVAHAGEGDYCHAFAVAGVWIFLFAKTDEASASLERTARLSPSLAARLPVRVPAVERSGRFGEADRVFVGYRRIEGRPLDPSVQGEARERCARDIAACLRHLHRFDVGVAAAAGVPVCPYPFAASEEGVRGGAAADEYREDLARIGRYEVVPRRTLRALERALAGHLDGAGDPQRVLLHGEISCEHVLVDPVSDGVTGIIDLNGMILGDPARDLLYLYEELGAGFVALLLAHDALDEPARDVLGRLRFMRLWHSVLRALWLLDRGYEGRAATRLAEVEALLAA